MTHFTTDDTRWQAVKTRDKNATHDFYYAVTTTGIYCVPGCPSRQPKRGNVQFFDTAAEARNAGFRPCKRCRPDDPTHASIDSTRVVAACRTIEQADQPPSLNDLAGAAGLSSSHFQRLFTDRVGVSPKVYGQAVRDTKVRRALEDGHSVTRAIFDAGYGASSRFYERSDKTLGMPPKAYRKGGKGLTIRYAFGTSFLGPILVAVTGQGVCAIEFGDEPEAMLRALKERFHQAAITDGSKELAPYVAEIAGFIKSPETGLDLPLDIQGTAFQHRVWQELTTIPPGETRTYTEVAEALNMPGSARAVATACAANRLAVAVPCHRVLRKSGQLAGYYWGLERKQALIENEKKDHSPKK